MKKRTTALLLATAALILDSRCAASAAGEALALCGKVLIPSLFPLLVVGGMLVPNLRGIPLPFLARLLGLPKGGEGILLLGCAGGFPVGAACICQAVRDGAATRRDAQRMLGLCSFCGPAFLFGVLPSVLPMRWVIALFVLQLETGLLLTAFWPHRSAGALQPSGKPVTLMEAVQNAVNSMISICAWVTIAGVAAGFLRRWLFPLLPPAAAVILTGLLELTNGIFALRSVTPSQAFVLCAVFVCFGGISVLLQIGGLAAGAGLRMGQCILQKAVHGILGAVTAAAFLHFGPGILFLPPAVLLAKIVLEIPGHVVYNRHERKGFECCSAKRWSAPATTAAMVRRWMKI